MSTDLRDTMIRAAGQPTRGPDVEAAIRQGTWLRRRRRSGIALTTVAVVAIAGVVIGPRVQLQAPEIASVGETDSPSLGTVVVHDAWLEVEDVTFTDGGQDGSPDEARSDQHLWDDEQQAWVGPVQTLRLYLEIPEGADGLLLDNDDGLLWSTRADENPGSWIESESNAGPWMVNVPLKVYHDRVHETAGDLEITIRAITSSEALLTGPTSRSDLPDTTETSAPTRLTDVRPEQ